MGVKKIYQINPKKLFDINIKNEDGERETQRAYFETQTKKKRGETQMGKKQNIHR